MAGYQFAHIDGYARQGGMAKTMRVLSAQQIADEAERKPGAHPHVKEPKPAILRHGVMPSEAVQLATAWAEQAVDPRGRKLRIDGLCLGAGVVSVPENMPDGLWPGYRDAVIGYLKARHGDRLKSVVEHVDEPHRHIHFYLVPQPGESFGAVHPGVAAARASAARGERKGLQQAAFNQAMKSWQDEIHSVSANFGLARFGPRRRRLSRAAWYAEQRAFSAHAAIIRATKPKGPTMVQINQIIAQQEVEHRAGLLGRGDPLYTKDQLLAATKAAALYGARHNASQRQAMLETVLLRTPEIDAAETRLAELAAREATIAHRMRKVTERVREAEEQAQARIEAYSLKVKQAEAIAIRAERWAKQTVTAAEARMRVILSPILAAFAAILRDPKAIEPKVEADAAIAALAELQPLATEIQQALYPVAKAVKKTHKVNQALGLDLHP
ncbi:mobilization protein [Aeromonas hydrophila]|uniref:mobilization protein n=1 Tax=Aeromonas TaxID=642 RepID=UPI000F9FE550